MLASSISEIFSRVLYQLKTRKVKETKVIQHSSDEIEIQLVIDEQERRIGPSVDDISAVLRTGFEQKIGPGVQIRVHEVDAVEKGPRIVSKVDISGYRVQRY